MSPTKTKRTATITDSKETWNVGGAHIECSAGCEDYVFGFKNSADGFEYGPGGPGETQRFWAQLGYEVVDLRAKPVR